MDSTLIFLSLVIFLFLALIILAMAVLYFQIRKIQSSNTGFPQLITGLIAALKSEETQIAVMSEKLAHIEPVNQTITDLAIELRGLGERVAKVENNQATVNQGVGNLAVTSYSTFSELKALTNSLSEATAAMRSELARAKNDLTELHAQAKNEHETERQIAESIKRLETVIAGTQSKGSAGENILEAVFSKLPIEWQVRNFRIGGKSVEFGLKLPNNLILPIDSKWAATNLLEQFLSSENTDEQQRLKKAIEDTVLQKAKEVKKYIDPSLTVNFGIAVIPDAIYDLCASIQTDVFQLNVVLVSYSMFIPYLLLVFQTILRAGQSIDLQKLDEYLQTAQSNLQALQDEIDGRLSKAITMLNNSRDDMRTHIGKIGGSLTGMQIGSGAPLNELNEGMLNGEPVVGGALP